MLNPNVLITALCVPMEKNKAVDDPTHRMGLPVNLIGGSGVGKSEYVEDVGEALRFFVHTVIPATSNPEDIGGYPVQDGKGGLTRLCDDAGIYQLIDTGEGILFLDEVNTNRAAMQAAYLRVVLKRIYGGMSLPNRCRIISAMNPPELSAGGIPLTPPMANRFCHIPFSAGTPREWSDWLLDYDGEKVESMYDAEKKVVNNWSKSWALSANQIAGFVRAKSDSLNKQPLPGDPKGSGAWPSSRTNFWAARTLATARALGQDGLVEDILLQGLCGEAWLTEFRAYVKAADLPDPETMLTKGWEIDTRRLDRTMTALETLGRYVADIPVTDPTRIDKAEKAWDFLHRACSSGLGDLCYRPARMLVNAKLSALSGSAVLEKAARPVLERLYKTNEIGQKIASLT